MKFKDMVEKQMEASQAVDDEYMRIMQEIEHTDHNSEEYGVLLTRAKELNAERLRNLDFFYKKDKDSKDRMAKVGSDAGAEAMKFGTTVFVVANILKFSATQTFHDKFVENLLMKWIRN